MPWELRAFFAVVALATFALYVPKHRLSREQLREAFEREGRRKTMEAWDDQPTIIVGIEGDVVFEAVVVGIKPGDPMPENFRVVERDYGRGNEPDEEGNLYEDREVS